MPSKYDMSQFLAMTNPYAPQPMMTPIPQAQAQAPVRQMISVPELPDQPQVPTKPTDPAAVQTLTQSPSAHQSVRMNSVLPPTQDEVDMNEAFKQLMENRQRNISGTQAELEDMKAQKAAYDGSFASWDLTGLNQLADLMPGGGKMAASYHAPTKGKEMEAMIQKLGEMNNKNIDGMGQDQLQFLKDRQALRNNKAMMDMAKADRFAQTQNNKLLGEMRKDLGGAADKLQDNMRAIDTVDAAVASGNYGALKGVLSNLGRGVGGEKGPLSDGDVQRVFPSSVATSLAGLEFYLNGKAAIPPDVKQQVMTLVNIGRQNAMNQAQERIQTHRQAFAAGAPDLMALGAPGHNTFAAYEDQLRRQMQGMQAPQAPTASAGGLQDPQSWLAKHRAGKAGS